MEDGYYWAKYSKDQFYSSKELVIVEIEGELVYTMGNEIASSIKNWKILRKIEMPTFILCEKCETVLKPSPDGPWCEKCDPGAPSRFHVQESQVGNY